MSALIASGALVLAAVDGRGASVRIESFDSALNGWTNAVGTTTWRATNGYAQLSLSASPAPASSALIATGLLGTASFTGDYRAAGIELIGFKFRAEQAAPSTLTLRLLGGTNGFFRNLQESVVATGVWYQFFVSLQGKTAGGWDGDPAEQFEAVLSNVTQVAVVVTKNSSMVATRYQVDDVVIDRLPAMTDAVRQSDGSTLVRADNLQTGVLYRVEQSPEVMGTWSVAGSLAATNREQTVSVTNTAQRLFWRLSFP